MIQGIVQEPHVSENDVAASICKDNLYEFIKEFWDEMVPVAPVWNWHIKYLCDELQELLERVFRREAKLYDLLINISPGSTKSTIASVGVPAWAWTRYLPFRSINGSHTHALALDLSRKCRDVITSKKYQAYFPDVQLQEDQNSKGYFANTKKGMRLSAGVGVSVIGFHADLLNVDDPIDPQGACSEEERKTANDWIDALQQRKVDKRISAMVVTMQRLAQNDPAGYWLDKMGEKAIKHICIPAIITENIKPVHLKDNYVDGLMDPVRLGRNELDEAKKTLGDVHYAGQYLQHPVPEGGVMFDVTALRRGACPLRFKNIVRFWDKAGTHKAGDYTVGVKMARCFDDYYWILDVVRGQWRSDVREKWMRQTAERDGTGVLVGLEQEPASAGKQSSEDSIRNLAGFRVRSDVPSGDKTLRAEPFSVQVNQGNVLIPVGHFEWLNAYIQEMQFFPWSTHDDQIDASSGAFTLLARGRTRVGAL